MNRLVLMMAAATLVLAGACGDDGGGEADGDVGPDVPVDVSPDAGDEGPDAPDAECTPQEIVSCGIGTAAGLTGEDQDQVVLYPSDEPSKYAGFPALQFDVQADTSCITAGALATLTVQGQQVSQQSVVGVDGAGGQARFTALTFPPSDADGYEVCVEVPTDDGSATCCKQVTVVTEACDVALVPPSAEGCLNEDVDPETPGFQTSLTVRHEGGTCDRASLAATFEGVDETYGPMDLDESGEATFEVTVGNDEEVVGALQVEAHALHPETDSLDGVLTAAYTVDSEAPALTIGQPTGDDSPLTLALDGNGDPDDGLQYDVRGEVSGLGADPESLVTLTVDGMIVDQVAPEAGIFVFEDVTFTQSGPVTLTVSAVDPCGNVGEDMAIVDVFGVAPDVAILTPLSDGVLKAVGDQDEATATIYERDFEVEADGVVEGTEIAIQCRAQGAETPFVPVGSIAAGEAPADSVYDVPVALDVAVLTNLAECRASVAGPNPATSAVVFLTIGLPAPGISLVAPVAGARLSSAVVTLVGEATGLDGQPIDVRVFSEGGQLLCELEAGEVTGGSFTVDADLAEACEGLADGTYFLQVDAEDVYGNIVSDLAGQSPQVKVVIDTTAPTLARVSPDVDVLDPVANPGDVDEDPATPGYQTTFVYRMIGEVFFEGAEICLVVNGVDQGCKVVGDVTFEATWTGVTLDPGVNTVQATGQDAFGNAAAPVDSAITLLLDAPVVKILEPAPGTITVDSTVDVVAGVSDSDSGSAIPGADVSLLVDGSDSGIAGVDGGDGTYTFTGVPLVEDTPVGLQVVAVFSGEEGASAVRNVTWKTTTPEVTVVGVPDGDALNLTAEACLGTQQDCQLTIEAATTDAEDGSTAGLEVACNGSTETFEAEVSDGTASFPGVLLLHGFTCTLTPSVTDLAGQEVTGEAVSIRVDRVAPSIGFKAPAGTKLLHVNDANPGTPDVMDHALSVNVSGVEAGQVITATFQWEDPDLGAQTETFTAEVPQDVPDGQTLAVSFQNTQGGSSIVYPDGAVMLSASVSDTAGNTASASKTVVVEPQAPSVRIIFPTFLGENGCSVESPCPSGGICHNAQCWHPWGLTATKQVTVIVAGLVSTQDNVRVCSDHADLAVAGTSCQSEGYYQVAISSVSGDNEVFDLSNLPQGFQTFIAEARPEPGGPWVSSVDEPDVLGRVRHVLVDDLPPEVEGIAFPGDTAVPQGVLNISEQASPAGDYKVRVLSSESGTATLFTNGKNLGTRAVEDGAALFQVVLDEGDNTVHAVVTDRAGNASPEPPDTVQVQVFVDRDEPSLTFANPGASPVVAGDVLDVILNSDKQGGQVTLLDGGVEVGTEMVVDGQAVFPHSEYAVLTDGTHTLTAEVVGPNGNANTAATTPAQILVDTTPPEAAIATPAEATTFTDAEDADPVAPGFQIDVDFTVGAGTASWSLLIASGCDASYANCATPSQVASGTVSGPAGADLSRTVTVPLTESMSHKQLLVRATDDVGNVGEGSVGVTFDIQECVAGFTDLVEGSWYNASFCPDGVSCAETTLQVTAQFFGPCGGVDEIRFLDGATVLDSTTDVASGGAVFDLTLQDGEEMNLELKLFSGGTEIGSSGVQTRRVDFTPPEVAFTATTVAGFVTPGEGAEELYNLESDASVAMPGFQGHVAVSITDANAQGGQLLSAVASTNGSDVTLTPSNVTLPSALSQASPVQRNLRDLTYPDQETSVVTVTASDAAGNEGVATFTATVDIVPPAPVELSPITETDVDPRLPSVSLQWFAVGDNGADAGFAEAYDIRYSRNPITTVDQFEAACSAEALAHAAPLPTPASAGLGQDYSVTGPDPRPLGVTVNGQLCKFAASVPDETFYFAVRAVDDAGNWSAINGGSVVSTSLVDTDASRVRFGPGFVAAAGGAFTETKRSFLTTNLAVVGDVNGDGGQDLVTGHNVSDAFCVFYGDLPADLVVETLSGPNHDCVVGASTVTGDGTASGLASWIDPLGDVNNDGLADFGVSGKIGSKGFVAVYLGVQDTGPDLANPNVILAGADAATTPYFGFCGAGDFTGDGNDDVAFGEEGLDLMRVIPGQDTWTGAGPTPTQIFWDLDTATDLTASGAFTIEADFGSPIKFGNRCARAGDVLPTPDGGTAETDELLVLQTEGADDRLFVIPGRAFSGGETVTLTAPDTAATAEDQIVVRLRQEELGIRNGYGQSVVGHVDVTGDGTADVIVAHSGREDRMGIYVFDGASIAAGAGGDLRIDVSGEPVSGSWVGANGYIVNADPTAQQRGIAVVDNIDGWLFGGVTTPDLVYTVGEATTFELVELRVNHETDDGSAFLGLYPFADAVYTNPFTTGALSLGTSVDGGVDLDGDTLPDIVLGTAKGEFVLIR